VQYFHQRFHHTDNVTPTAKELDLAAAWITQYGTNQSRFIVDYSLTEAQTTKYTPKMLLGIRQYVDAAIKTLEAQERREAQRNLEARESQFKNYYKLYQKREIDHFKATLSPQELAAMEDAIRAELIAEGTFPAMVNLGVHVKLNAALADRAGVLPYDEWRKQQE
jgi:hypothetical protein